MNYKMLAKSGWDTAKGFLVLALFIAFLFTGGYFYGPLGLMGTLFICTFFICWIISYYDMKKKEE